MKLQAMRLNKPLILKDLNIEEGKNEDYARDTLALSFPTQEHIRQLLSFKQDNERAHYLAATLADLSDDDFEELAPQDINKIVEVTTANINIATDYHQKKVKKTAQSRRLSKLSLFNTAS